MAAHLLVTGSDTPELPSTHPSSRVAVSIRADREMSAGEPEEASPVSAPTRAAAQAPRGRPERRVSAREDDRAVAVHEDAALRVEADGLG